MAVESNAKPKAYTINGISIIHYIVVAFFCLIFRYIPGVGGITPMGMGVLGCFIGAVYGWSTIDMIWPSIMAMCGMGFVVGMNAMASATFGNSIIVCMLFIFPALGVMTSTGAMDYLVNKALTNKAALGKPWLTIFLLLMACALLCTLNSVIVCVVFCSFFSTICRQIGIKPYTKLPTFLFLGIAYAGMLGQVMIPFMGQGLALIGSYAAMFGDELNFALYLLFSVPMTIVMIVVYVLLMRFVFRVDAAPFKSMTLDMLGERKKCSRDQRMAIVFFAAWMIVILCSAVKFFGPVYKFLSHFGIVGVAMVLVLLMTLIRKEDGTPLLSFKEEAKHLSWDALLLTAFVLLMSTFMSNPETGISAALAHLLQPFTTLPPMLFIVIALVFAALITNVANNLVIAIMVMPFMYNYATMIGMSPTGVMVLLFIMSQFALATPGASALTGICFAQTSMVRAGDMTKYACLLLPFLIVTGLLIGLSLQTLLF